MSLITRSPFPWWFSGWTSSMAHVCYRTTNTPTCKPENHFQCQKLCLSWKAKNVYLRCRTNPDHAVTPCGNHTVLVQFPLILRPALLWRKASLLCSVLSRLRKAQAGWRWIWSWLIGIELVLTECRPQLVGVMCDHGQAPGRLLGMAPHTGPWQQGLWLTSSDFKVFNLPSAIKLKIIYLFITSPFQGNHLPFYPTKLLFWNICL